MSYEAAQLEDLSLAKLQSSVVVLASQREKKSPAENSVECDQSRKKREEKGLAGSAEKDREREGGGSVGRECATRGGS